MYFHKFVGREHETIDRVLGGYLRYVCIQSTLDPYAEAFIAGPLR